jgi:hypothetical protein
MFCCCLSIGRRIISAQASATSKQICTPAMLNVSDLPTPPSFTYGEHLFVLEFQNISPASCSLPPLQPTQVSLIPNSDTNNQHLYSTMRTDDPGHATESRPQVLSVVSSHELCWNRTDGIVILTGLSSVTGRGDDRQAGDPSA